eukprot:CAMPEP_0172671764 /NCGR_PEP_ID=MMETSP1074-20121228/11122_1 /TAXON_ID=2916 /ORGANISM="Ceratium fusus, Strain PA161109" /LENGTH=253 /DNA_ID=CAMNT_0013488865 /DNA_START=34 /DNA_END=791 /DNA_ORIENTATION=+
MSGRSRSPHRTADGCSQLKSDAQVRPAFLCLILGGPGSGKTSLGHRLGGIFKGLCHVSSGDIARLATNEQAHKSPLLNSIGRQLGDRRRRKQAMRRLKNITAELLVDCMRNNPKVVGLIADGFRATDILGLQQDQDLCVTCVLRIECAHEIMLARFQERGRREGDDKLGLHDSGDSAARIEAYMQRVDEEEKALKAFYGERYEASVFVIDGCQPPEQCHHAASEFLRNMAGRQGLTFEEGEFRQIDVDWAAQL